MALIKKVFIFEVPYLNLCLEGFDFFFVVVVVPLCTASQPKLRSFFPVLPIF